MNKKIIEISKITSILLLVSALNAQGNETTVLDDVTITTGRMAKSINSVPNTVTVINKDEIEKQTLIDDSLAGILEKTVPGFAPSSQKMSGGGETLRGKNPLYMIDGISQHNSLRDGLRDGFSIDSDFLESVEVVQGANAIQGIGATGGVVQMNTKTAKGNGKLNSEIKIKTSFDDNLNSDSLGTKLTYIGDIVLGKYDFVGGVSYHSRGLFYDGNSDRVGYRTAQGELQDSDSLDLFLKSGYNIDSEQRIQFMANKYTLENNGDLIPVSGDRDAGIYGTTIDGDSSSTVGNAAKNDVTSLSLNYSNLNLAGGKLSSQLYWQDYSALFEGSVSSRWQLTPGGESILDQSEIKSKKYGTKLSYEYDDTFKIDGLRTMVGFDYSVDESSQKLAVTNRYWVPPMELKTKSPFMQFEYSIGDLLLSAGARYEMADLNVDGFTTLASYNNTYVDGGTPSYEKLLKNIGAVYYLSDDLSVYASYSEGFDMPDVGRVLRGINTSGQDVDNIIDLEPVITNNIEVGLNIDKDKWSSQISVYQSSTDLGSRLVDNNGIYDVQREKQEIKGFDIVAKYMINPNMTIGGNYSYIKGEFDSDDDGKVDTDITNTNISPNKLSLFTLNRFNSINTRLQVSHFFDKTQKGDSAYTDYRKDFNGYTLVDFSGQYVSKLGTFGLGIENLLDKEYETLYSQTQSGDDRYFSGRGRTITLSYSKKF